MYEENIYYIVNLQIYWFGFLLFEFEGIILISNNFSIFEIEAKTSFGMIESIFFVLTITSIRLIWVPLWKSF